MSLAGGPNANVAGIIFGKAQGYFEEEGLEFVWAAPATPVAPVRYVVGGEVEVALAAEPQVFIARQKGAPIVAIGSLVSGPTSALIWPEESDIEDVADLKGKTIAIAGLPYEKALVKSILNQANLGLRDVKVDAVYYDLIPALVKGRADAILGERNIHGLELEERGMEPVVTPVEDLGVPDYDQMVLIARRDRLREDPGSIRKMMAALARSTAAVAEDPAAATQEINANAGMYRLGSTPEGVPATIPLLSRTNRLDPKQWARFATWMQEQGLLDKPVDASDLVTDAYLPSDAG